MPDVLRHRHGDGQHQQRPDRGEADQQRHAEIDQPAIEQKQPAHDDRDGAPQPQRRGRAADDQVLQRRQGVANQLFQRKRRPRGRLRPGGEGHQPLRRRIAVQRIVQRHVDVAGPGLLAHRRELARAGAPREGGFDHVAAAHVRAVQHEVRHQQRLKEDHAQQVNDRDRVNAPRPDAGEDP